MKLFRITVLAATVSLFTLAGIGNAQTADEKEAINSFYRDWSQAVFKEGPEGYARFFAQDGAVLPPDEVPVVGRAAIKEWMKRTLAEATYVTRPEGVTQDDLKVTGNLAVARSAVRGKRTPKSGGESFLFETKYLDVLRKTSDGRWEFVYRMWNNNLRSR
jgi:uncharacterized protein (TIGR02246 family)